MRPIDIQVYLGVIGLVAVVAVCWLVTFRRGARPHQPGGSPQGGVSHRTSDATATASTDQCRRNQARMVLSYARWSSSGTVCEAWKATRSLCGMQRASRSVTAWKKPGLRAPLEINAGRRFCRAMSHVNRGRTAAE